MKFTKQSTKKTEKSNKKLINKFVSFLIRTIVRNLILIKNKTDTWSVIYHWRSHLDTHDRP